MAVAVAVVVVTAASGAEVTLAVVADFMAQYTVAAGGPVVVAVILRQSTVVPFMVAVAPELAAVIVRPFIAVLYMVDIPVAPDADFIAVPVMVPDGVHTQVGITVGIGIAPGCQVGLVSASCGRNLFGLMGPQAFGSAR